MHFAGFLHVQIHSWNANRNTIRLLLVLMKCKIHETLAFQKWIWTHRRWWACSFWCFWSAFSSRHSQFLAFSLVNWRTWWQRIVPLAFDRFSTYIFFYSIRILSLIIEFNLQLNEKKSYIHTQLYTHCLYTVRSVICRHALREVDAIYINISMKCEKYKSESLVMLSYLLLKKVWPNRKGQRDKEVEITNKIYNVL